MSTLKCKMLMEQDVLCKHLSLHGDRAEQGYTQVRPSVHLRSVIWSSLLPHCSYFFPPLKTGNDNQCTAMDERLQNVQPLSGFLWFSYKAYVGWFLVSYVILPINWQDTAIQRSLCVDHKRELGFYQKSQNYGLIVLRKEIHFLCGITLKQLQGMVHEVSFHACPW